ncbi:aminoglycoside adenylyltransferase domain-containing protein [Streptomyces ramulosus]|uniref:Aminoglycoside adenylyltransferase domain-containing protein n=1 Tax=Streptomyces ramulosus TaxID=47762 RepID=A0ABW1FFU2_9ACTN
MDADVPDSVVRVVPDLLGEILPAVGERLVGIYLYGSAVSGSFDEGVSDVDLMVATDSALSDVVVDALASAHERFWAVHPDFLDRIDIVYAPTVTLSGTVGMADDLPPLLTVSPGSPLHATQATQEWVLNRRLVFETGVTLAGAPARSVVAPVSLDEVRDAVARKLYSLREWAPSVRHRGGHAYVVLTTCRALLTLTTGRQVSKAEAAEWVRCRQPQFRLLIDSALEWRQAQAVRDETPLPESLVSQIVDLLDLACASVEEECRGLPSGC